MEKVYAVWSGEYEDRTVHAIFKSKELSEHYAKEQEKINEYSSFWVMEYELYDNNFTLEDIANKYYYASVYCKDKENFALEIETDELWDDFLHNYAIDSLVSDEEDKYDPAVYSRFMKDINLSADEEEKQYALSIEYRLNNRMVIVESYDYTDGKVFIVYSRLGYHDARKIALEQAQQYIQKEKCNG